MEAVDQEIKVKVEDALGNNVDLHLTSFPVKTSLLKKATAV
jgi:hypothetical protein